MSTGRYSVRNRTVAGLVSLLSAGLFFVAFPSDAEDACWATYEVSGTDTGEVCENGRFQDGMNFVINSLAVGGVKPARVKLVDESDNGNRGTAAGKEALYVRFLVVTEGSTLDLNGLHVYVSSLSDIRGTVINGELIIQCET